jgi:hypothetical protein
MQAEDRYEKFCSEYVPTLPPAFGLEPDKRWDTQFPKLAMQRQLLHIAILDSVCWNFRPLLLLSATELALLPSYKHGLVQSQRTRLAIAALRELEAVSALHSLFGGSQIRFSAIIFNTFEAAVLLLCLSSQIEENYLYHGEDDLEILGTRTARPSRARIVQAVETALNRLRMLSGVSEMAASATKVVGELLAQAGRGAALSPVTGSGRSSAWANSGSELVGNDFGADVWNSPQSFDENLVDELFLDIGGEQVETGFQFPYGED